MEIVEDWMSRWDYSSVKSQFYIRVLRRSDCLSYSINYNPIKGIK